MSAITLAVLQDKDFSIREKAKKALYEEKKYFLHLRNLYDSSVSSPLGYGKLK